MKLLIIIDMQNDFIDGVLGTEEAKKIVPRVRARIEEARREGIPVIATQDTHGPDYLSTREGRLLPVPHCIRGTQGWQIAPELQECLRGCTVVEKDNFATMALTDRIREVADDLSGLEIEIAGLCTDICVVNNAMVLRMTFPESTIRVLASCCAGVTPEKHLAALEVMKSCQILVEGEE